MELDFDTPNLRERDAVVMRQGKACLRVGEAVKLVSALVAGEPRGITALAPGKERLERLVYFP